MTPKKQKSILDSLYNAIDRLLNPDKQKAANDRSAKKRKENGKQEAANARFAAKMSKATREANRQAILETKTTRSPHGMKPHSKD
jgi:hypothetical protein